jgi:ketosteroid isomerase-like protein
MTDQRTDDAREGVAAAIQDFMTTFALGDAAGVAALYTQSGQLLPTNRDVITGAPAIQAFWQTAMDIGVKEIILETRELEAFGDTTHEVGRYTLRGDLGLVLDQGKYVVIWKREGGQWRIHREIGSSSLPAAQPAET